MTLQESLTELFKLLNIRDPGFCLLGESEQVGYMFAERWGRCSKISGHYLDKEILEGMRILIVNETLRKAG